MGRFVDSLGGRYIVAEDVGVSVADVQHMAKETAHVAGTPEKGSGDPSPATAFGVYMGLKTAVGVHYGSEDLRGCRVAIQGSARWAISSPNAWPPMAPSSWWPTSTPRWWSAPSPSFGARAVAPEDIYDQEVEVFSPCALGAVLNDETIPRLQAGVIVGSANNQLAEARHGRVLAEAGKLYAPDYLVNAGGVINISHEGPSYRSKSAPSPTSRASARP